MLEENNALVKSFRCVRDKFNIVDIKDLHIRLINSRSFDGCLYNTPTASEVAGQAYCW